MNTQFEIAKESKQPQNTAEGKNFKKLTLAGLRILANILWKTKN